MFLTVLILFAFWRIRQYTVLYHSFKIALIIITFIVGSFEDFGRFWKTFSTALKKAVEKLIRIVFVSPCQESK